MILPVDWRASQSGLEATQEQAKLLAAQVALLEQKMAGGKTDEMSAQYARLKVELRETRAEAKAMAEQLTALNAIKPAAAAAAPLLDESARYEAYWKQAEEQERSRRAHEAMSSSRLAMPAASAPTAAISVAEGVAEEGAAVAAGFGLSRMGKMELGHVARSLAGSVAAGAPLDRAVGMEGPRILSVLGEMGLGMSTLLPIFGALAPVVAAAAAAFTVYNANKAASKTRQAISEIGENETNLGDLASDLNNDHLDWQSRRRRFQKRNRQERLELNKPENVQLPSEDVESTKDLDKDIEAAQKKVEAAEAERRTKIQKFARFFGGGTKRSNVQEAVAKREQIVNRRDDVADRDQGFAEREFDGDPSVEADKLKVTLNERLSQIQKDQDSRKINDGARQMERAQKEYNLAMQELARRQAGQENAVQLEGKILAIKKDGLDVAEKTAAAQLEGAQRTLDAGPKEGPQHEANVNAVESARQGVDLAGREKQRQDAEDARTKGLNADRAGGSDTEASRARRAFTEALRKRDSQKEGSREWDVANEDVKSSKLDITEARRNLAERASKRQRAAELAAMTGPQSERERARLVGDQQDLNGQLRDGSPTYERNAEKRKDLELELARNKGDVHALDRSDKQREFQRQDEEISANTTPGTSGQVKAINDRLGLNADRQADNDANEKSVDVAARLNAEAAELKRRKEEILFTEKESLEALKRQGEEIQNHGLELDAAGKKKEIDGKYTPQIEKAEHDHDPANAAQLRQNEAGEEFGAEVDEEQMTPAQKAERARHNLARNQAAARVESRHKRQADLAAANAPADLSIKHMPPPSHMAPRPIIAPNRIDEIKAGAMNAGKGDGGFKDGNIVKGLQDVVKAVDKISLKNKK